jgi:hypothetical protein
MTIHQRHQIAAPVCDAAGAGIGHGEDAHPVLECRDLLPEDIAAPERTGDQQKNRARAHVNKSPFAPVEVDPLFGMAGGEGVAAVDQGIAHAKGSSTAGQ